MTHHESFWHNLRLRFYERMSVYKAEYQDIVTAMYERLVRLRYILPSQRRQAL